MCKYLNLKQHGDKHRYICVYAMHIFILYACMYVCVYVCMYVLYIYIYTHVYLYIDIIHVYIDIDIV